MGGGGGAILDIRPAREFATGHIPRAYGIALESPLVTWAGWLIPHGTSLVLVAKGRKDLEEAVRQLLRIGYDDLRGYLRGGMAAWRAADLPAESVPLISPANLRERIGSKDAPVVLDVRQDDEWEGGHIPGAVHVENGRLPEQEFGVFRGRPVVVHCAGWNRSTAGLSILTRRGYRDVFLLEGGFVAWQKAGFEVVRG